MANSTVGEVEGTGEGADVGAAEGVEDGPRVSVGEPDGSALGEFDGPVDGATLGSADGAGDGAGEGPLLGSMLGALEGASVGLGVGAGVGEGDGEGVGALVGLGVGDGVGAGEGAYVGTKVGHSSVLHTSACMVRGQPLPVAQTTISTQNIDLQRQREYCVQRCSQLSRPTGLPPYASYTVMVLVLDLTPPSHEEEHSSHESQAATAQLTGGGHGSADSVHVLLSDNVGHGAAPAPIVGKLHTNRDAPCVLFAVV